MPCSTDSHLLAQISLLNEALDLMRSLTTTEGSLPNYAQTALGAESEEIYILPTTHFIATIEDLTDVLDYGCEDMTVWTTMREKSRPKTRHLPDAG